MNDLPTNPKTGNGTKRHRFTNGNHGRRPSMDKINNPGIIYEVGHEVWYEDGVDEWTEAIIIELRSNEVALEFVDSNRKVCVYPALIFTRNEDGLSQYVLIFCFLQLYGVSLNCIAPIEFETDDELYNLLSEFELEDHYDSVLSVGLTSFSAPT